MSATQTTRNALPHRMWGGALRDDTKNDCVAYYELQEASKDIIPRVEYREENAPANHDLLYPICCFITHFMELCGLCFM